jgi:serine/threonine protein kinase
MMDGDVPVLIDFGSAMHVPDGKLTTYCGTLSYAAPEIYRGFFSKTGSTEIVMAKPCDVWAVACTIFYVVFNELPFFTPAETNDPDFIPWGQYESPVTDVLYGIMDPYPDTRYNLKWALTCDYFYQ